LGLGSTRGASHRKPRNKFLAVTDRDFNTWVAEMKRTRGMKLLPTAAGVQGSPKVVWDQTAAFDDANQTTKPELLWHWLRLPLRYRLRWRTRASLETLQTSARLARRTQAAPETSWSNYTPGELG
jgi:hypothetical protein